MNDWEHSYNHFGMSEEFSNGEFLSRIDMSSLENAKSLDDSVFDSKVLEEYKEFKQFWTINGFFKDVDFVDIVEFIQLRDFKFEEEDLLKGLIPEEEKESSLCFHIDGTVFDECSFESTEPVTPQFKYTMPQVEPALTQVEPAALQFDYNAFQLQFSAPQAQPAAPRIENIYIKRCAENNVFKIGRTILPSKLKKGTQIFQCKNSRLMKRRIIEAFRKKYKQARSYGIDCFEGSYNSMVILIGSILVKEK